MLGYFKLTVANARNLPKTDQFGKTDPFIEVHANGEIESTPVVKSCFDPIWNHTVDMSSHVDSSIRFILFDKDLTSNEKIAYTECKLADLMRRDEGGWFKAVCLEFTFYNAKMANIGLFPIFSPPFTTTIVPPCFR